MKNMVKSLIIVLFLSFLFSCQKKSQLEQSLELAGKNRIELEKVLEHYSKDSKDKLKLKAAQYLIENMDTCFSITSPELDAYYKTIDSIFTLNGSENITPTQESLLKQLNMPDLNFVEPVPDLQTVSSDFLIDNIDRAFEAWKSPFAKDMNFDDFCEYLLPYKVNPSDFPDSSWRSTFHDTFYPYVKFALDTVCHLDSGIVLQYLALTLDGNKFINLPDHLFDTLPEFTVCSWANQDEYRKWARVFDLGGTTWNCYVCFMPYTPDSLSQFEMKTPTTWNAIQDAHMAIGQRSHIALSYSNIYMSFYINGSLKRRMTPPLTHFAARQIRNLCKSANSIFWNSDLCTTNFRLVNG